MGTSTTEGSTTMYDRFICRHCHKEQCLGYLNLIFCNENEEE